jgi:5'-3' exonuclease
MKKKKAQWRDPIVEEIHRFREEYAKKFNYDLEKMFLDLKRQEEETAGPVVSFIREAPTATSPPTAPAHPSKRRDT